MAAEVQVIGTFVDDASGGLSGFAGTLGNLGNIVTGIKSAFDLVGGAIDATVGFVQPFIDSASESEQAVARLEGVLRATGGAVGLTSDQLQGMADSLQNTTRFSDETILAGESLLLTFRNIGGETFERTVPAMLDMAEIFGSVDSAAMQLGKALNDPLTGMGALSRAGITFSEDQKLAIKAFMDTNDIASAQNIILTEVEAQVQGLAETMGQTFAGQSEIFKNKLDSIKETIGGALLPVLGDLLGTFMEFVDRPEIMGFFEQLASNISAFPTDPLFAITDTLYSLGYTLEQLGLTGANNFFSSFGDALLSNDLVGALGEWLVSWVDSVDWNQLSNKIADGISSIDWGEVGNVIAQGLGYLAIAIGNVLAAIDWGALLSSVGSALANLIAGLFGFINWDDMISSAKVGFSYVGQEIVDGLKSGLLSMWNNFLNLPFILVDDFIKNFQSMLGIASRSTVFYNIGINIVQGLIDGFKGAWDTLLTIAQNALGDFFALFGIDLSAILGTGGGAVGGTPGTHPGPSGPIPTEPTGGSVVNNYYGPVYFQGGTEPGSYYECPSPSPLVAASGNQLVTTGF